MTGNEMFGCGAWDRTPSRLCRNKVTCFVSYHTFNALNQLSVHKDRPMCDYHLNSVRQHCKVLETIEVEMIGGYDEDVGH